LTTTDLDGGNGVNPDGILSTTNGNPDTAAIQFDLDMMNTPFTALKLTNTTDWIVPTGVIVPVPGAALLGIMGLSTAAAKLRRRRA
jgi:hypothetical protein